MNANAENDQQVVAICCVCSRKYLPQALTMIWSLRQQPGSYSFHVFLSDVTSADRGVLAQHCPGIEFFYLDEYADENILDNILLLTDLEFNTSLKAVALSAILEKYRRKTFYCDSDLFFLAPPDKAVAALDQSHVVITPHQSGASSDETDFAMARTGVFNSGFVGLAGTVGIAFAEWWMHKTDHYCLMEPEEGLFVDQKWLDLAPALFDGVCVLRDAGYNLAYWNWPARTFDQSTVFLHLSGFNLGKTPTAGDRLSKFSTLTMSQTLAEALQPYLEIYTQMAAQMDSQLPCPSDKTVTDLFAQKQPVIERRYLVKNFKLAVVSGSILQQKRAGSGHFNFIRLFRSEPGVLKMTRRLGGLLVQMRMAAIVEAMISLFRVLGRRTNWLY